MRESVRFARQVGRALLVVLAVTAIIALVSGAGAANGGQPPASPIDAAADDLDGPTAQLNETTDELDNETDEVENATDEVDATTESLTDTAEELDETTEELRQTTSIGETVDGELTVDLNGTLLEEGTLSTTILGAAEASGSDDDSGGGSAADGSSGGAAGAESTTDGPSPSDAVDPGLIGVLGGLALLGKSGASGTGAAGSAGARSSGLVGRFARHVRRLGGTLSSLLGKLPLTVFRYSRYDDSDPLDHETRRNIYEAIEADPGLYLSALEDDQDVSLSTIRHHLSVLEDEGLLEAEKQNGKRRYYTARTEDVELAAALDEPAKVRVLDVLAETGDARNGRIADALDLDPSTVSHHLSTLEDDGLIERRRDGRSIVNSLTPAVESAYRSRTESVSGPDADATEWIPTYSDD